VVSAGIVTFEPDLVRLRENLAAIAPQVDSVYVFDNGSSNAAGILDIASRFDALTVIREPANLGIATALNRISERAAADGCSWLLTLDQDSVCPPDMVRVLQEASTERSALVTPYIVDRNKTPLHGLQLDSLPEVQEFRQPARKSAITSGSLMRLSAWQQVGGFDDRFFIDYVDYDFNQRLLDGGFSILRSNRTHLLHETGAARPTWLRVPRKDIDGTWRIERFYSFGHDPFRCYYKARNRVLFTRKHGRKLGITHEGIWQIPQQIALTLLFEPQRRAKMSAFARGIRDGFREKMR